MPIILFLRVSLVLFNLLFYHLDRFQLPFHLFFLLLSLHILVCSQRGHEPVSVCLEPLKQGRLQITSQASISDIKLLECPLLVPTTYSLTSISRTGLGLLEALRFFDGVAGNIANYD